MKKALARNVGAYALAAGAALGEAVALCRRIAEVGLKVDNARDLPQAIQAEHLALTSAAILKAVVELLAAGGGSRGSYLVTCDDGQEIHPDIIDSRTGKPLRMKPEDEFLRQSILRVTYSAEATDLFTCETIAPRKVPTDRKAFEPAWKDFREGAIFTD